MYHLLKYVYTRFANDMQRYSNYFENCKNNIYLYKHFGDTIVINAKDLLSLQCNKQCKTIKTTLII